ncbi:MAG TPA: SusC/RagA family TonB-linked outer membrane protein [Flavitalea sp.]|nr:SusC/RagA family TonB-linked outer membrane protein [Flavitalea sp.]
MIFSVIPAERLRFTGFPPKFKLLFEKSTIKHIMRIGLGILFVITTSIQLVFAADVKSQSIDEVEVRVELKNESLVKAFQKIEAQSPFRFMYRLKEVKDIRHLSTTNTRTSVEDLLKTLLANTSLTYRQIDNQVLIVSAGKPETGDIALAGEKPRSADVLIEVIRGRVTDANGEPLAGVSVTLKGTNIGTTTDQDGRYSISIPGAGTLVFSSIGSVTQEVAVSSSRTLDIRLVEEAASLNQVVVTALGIKREAKSLTYSTQSVDPTQLKQAREPNVMLSLQGKVAGLTITESGSGLGAPARVILRGNRSISGDSQPLYIIDGVPVGGAPTNLSPDNIASIDVLKGPNAAALYGSIAQNGAIIITTYSGLPGVTNISLSSSYITQTPILGIEFQNEYGQGSGGVYNRRSDMSWGPKMEGQMVDHWSPDPKMAGVQYSFLPQPNNVRDFFNTGGNFVNNLLINLGGEKTQTVFSYTRTDATGMVPNNTLRRNNLSLRVSSSLTSKLSLDAKIEYMRQETVGSINGQGGFESSIENLYNIPRNIRLEDMRVFEYTDLDGSNKQNYWTPGSAFSQSPYWRVYRNETSGNGNRVIGLTSLKYDFTKEFNIMARASFDGGGGFSHLKTYNDTYNRGNFGRYTVELNNGMLFNGDFLATYTKNINQDWNITANAGGNIRKQRTEALSSNTGPALTVPNFFALSNTQQVVSTFGVGAPSDIHSLYAFLRAGWKNALFLDLTARNDWSSTLPASERSYFYPSVGLGAVLTDLIPSMRGDFLSYAKLRGSWAQVGSGARPFQLDRTALVTAGGYDGFFTLSPTLPNVLLRPELTKSAELGAEAQFFNGRIGLNLTAYKTNTTNQLFTLQLPIGSGATEAYVNGGDVENKGIEALLFANPVRTGDFKWDLNLNFSTNKNTVLKIHDKRPRVPLGYLFIEQGQPYGNIYGRGLLRDDQGRVIVGPNGVPRNTAANILVANFNPSWLGSISNTFSFKDFSLSFMIDHRQGGTMVSWTDGKTYGDGHAKATLEGREGGLVFGENFFAHETAVFADGTPNNVPITAQQFWSAVGGRNQTTDEIFTVSATNTRLREATLGYTLSAGGLSKARIARMHFSLVGRNLFFIHRAAKTVDPDLQMGTSPGSDGISGYALPTTRSMGLSVKIDFQ